MRCVSFFFSLTLTVGLVLLTLVSSMAKTGGYVETAGYYFTEPVQDKERLDMEINLETTFPFYNIGKGFMSCKFYADDLFGKTSKNTPSVDEAYLDFYTQDFDIRLGKQYIFWGRTSGVNTPTNNINPQDLTKIKPDAEEMRVGVNALKANYFRGFDLVFQGVWIPGFASSKLPSFSLPLYVVIGEEKRPGPELENSSWGLKIDKFGRVGDFSFSYLYTWDSFPDYEIDISEYPSVTLVPVYHRVRIFGADFATGIAGFDVKGEVAYFQTEDKNGESLSIKNSHLKYTFELGYPPADNFDVILQLQGKIVFDFKSPEEYPSELRQLAEQISFFYSEQKEWQTLLGTHLIYRMWHDRLKLEFIGNYNLTLQDYLLSPKLSYEIGGGLNLGFGAMIFEGEPNTQFGAMGDNDCIWYELSYSF